MLTYLSTPVTSLLMICSDEQFSFHIVTEQGWKIQLRRSTGREFHMHGPATVKLWGP